jgi:hypothetical protein
LISERLQKLANTNLTSDYIKIADIDEAVEALLKKKLERDLELIKNKLQLEFDNRVQRVKNDIQDLEHIKTHEFTILRNSFKYKFEKLKEKKEILEEMKKEEGKEEFESELYKLEKVLKLMEIEKNRTTVEFNKTYEPKFEKLKQQILTEERSFESRTLAAKADLVRKQKYINKFVVKDPVALSVATKIVESTHQLEPNVLYIIPIGSKTTIGYLFYSRNPQ